MPIPIAAVFVSLSARSKPQVGPAISTTTTARRLIERL